MERPTRKHFTYNTQAIEMKQAPRWSLGRDAKGEEKRKREKGKTQ